MAYGPGQTNKFYWGLQATVPTDQADETAAVYNAIGEIPGDIQITRSRGVIPRFTRDDPNARLVHAGDREESISFVMDFDRTGNAGYDDLLTAYGSDADGVGAAGTEGYWNVTNGVAGDHQWYGTGIVTQLDVTVTRTSGPMTVSVGIAVSGDMTDAAHA